MNNKTHKNESAYPSGMYGQQTERGLSKREFFANNCPNEIPEWFDIEFELPKQDFPNWWDIKWDSEKDKILVESWVKDGIFDLPDHLQWYSDKRNEYYDKLQEAKKQKVIDRYFAWRAYYADNLTDALNK